MRLSTFFSLLTTVSAQFNLLAVSDEAGVGNKTICMSGGKAILDFPPDNSCVFTFRGGILTAYTTNGILFNEGEQLTESTNFRGSQIMFRNNVLDPPNNWQFTACPGDEWTVWMDANCEGGVKFDALLTTLDDNALRSMEAASRDEEANESTSTSTDTQTSTNSSESSSEASTSSETSSDSPSSSSSSSTGPLPILSTRTVTEVVTVTGLLSGQVTEVTTTRTVTMAQSPSSSPVATVTRQVTTFIGSGNQANVQTIDISQRAQSAVSDGSPAWDVAGPTSQASVERTGTPAWGVGAPETGDTQGQPTQGQGNQNGQNQNGQNQNPNQDGQNNGRPGVNSNGQTIWWTQSSSPWWTQQTAPWWTPESVLTASSQTGSARSSSASGTSTAQENASQTTTRLPRFVEILTLVFSIFLF